MGRTIRGNKTKLPGEHFEAIIPKTALIKAISICEDAGINLYQQGPMVIFESGDYTIYSKLFLSNFVDYKSLLNITPIATLNIKRSELLFAVQRAAIFSLKKGENIKFIGTCKQFSVSFAGEYNSFNENITAESNSDAAFKIALSPKYLLDALKATDENDIMLNYQGKNKAVIISDGTMQQMIMPMRYIS